MVESIHPEIIRGRDVTIDLVLLRHAEREPIDLERIKNGWSPPLTEMGLLQSELFGYHVLQSPPFLGENYNFVRFTGTHIKRTHQTAQAIKKGADFPQSAHPREYFPMKVGEGIDRTLRLRPDGKAWNKEKITYAIDTILPFASTIISSLCTTYHQEEAFGYIMDQIQKGLDIDTSYIAGTLCNFFPDEIARESTLRITSALFDTMLDASEVKAYMERPLSYLNNLTKFTLKNMAAGTKMLVVGVTHDFNLAGLLKGTIGAHATDGEVKPIDSFIDIGGPPDYLAHILFRLERNGQGEFSPSVYYNGQQFCLLPQVQTLLISNS